MRNEAPRFVLPLRLRAMMTEHRVISLIAGATESVSPTPEVHGSVGFVSDGFAANISARCFGQ